MGLGYDIEINLPSIVIEGVGLNFSKESTNLCPSMDKNLNL